MFYMFFFTGDNKNNGYFFGIVMVPLPSGICLEDHPTTRVCGS